MVPKRKSQDKVLGFLYLNDARITLHPLIPHQKLK